MGEPQNIGAGLALNHVSFGCDIDRNGSNSNDFALFQRTEFKLRDHDEPHLVGDVFNPQFKVILVFFKYFQDFDEEIKFIIFIVLVVLLQTS